MNAKPKPQQFAQKMKLPRGWAIVRNSATLATTDYEHIADEIVAALNAKFQETNLVSCGACQGIRI